MRPSSRTFSLAGLAVGAALAAAACSSAASTPTSGAAGATGIYAAPSTLVLGVTNDPALGSYITGLNGMTMYVLTKDSPDTSTCTGSCSTNWPPVVVTNQTTLEAPVGGTGAVATSARPDGTLQVTYNHRPLYYYAGDSKAGDTNGQGKNNTWFVAPLSGVLASPGAGASSMPSAAATATGAAAPTPAPTAAATYSYGY
jgi:predicted lipoprotein with Yx(FWY)xxD motif